MPSYPSEAIIEKICTNCGEWVKREEVIHKGFALICPYCGKEIGPDGSVVVDESMVDYSE